MPSLLGCNAFNLRKEPAVGITALAVLALLVGVAGMWAFQHQAEFQELHQRLSGDVNEMLRQIRVFDQQSAADAFEFNQELVPLDLQKRLLELRTTQERLLYRSPQINKPPTAGDGSYQDADGKRHRLEVFRVDGLIFYVNADLDPDDSFIHEIGGGLVVAVPAMFVIILIGALWVRDRALRPVEHIRRGIAEVTATSLDRPIQSPSAPAEITDLVSALNVTFKDLHASFEQAARFSADASHHLKTPLAVLRLGIEDLLNDPHMSNRQRACVGELLSQIHRLTSIVEDLLLLSRADARRLSLQRQPFDFHQLLSSFLDDISTLAEEKGITLETKILAQRPVVGDLSSIALILENLMENAIKYNRPDGRIRLVATDNAEWTELSVANTGEPIPPERAPYIFQRFFRAHGGEERSGSGLGLSIARELVEANQGQLELVRSTDEWTEFRLRLPSVEGPVGRINNEQEQRYAER